MNTRHLLIALPFLLLAVPVLAAGSHLGGHNDEAIGKPGVASKVTRSITLEMTDAMRFSVPKVMVKQGETIRFVVKNAGKLKHEMVLGTEKELSEHDAAMMKNPEMVHADANMVSVAPGSSGDIIWQFTQAGKVNFACLQPGHYAAGMKGLVTVAAGPVTVNGTAHLQHQVQSPAVIALGGTAEANDRALPVPPASGDMTDAEVRKVDLATQRITLKHGEIKNLDMPGMTMVFQVKAPALLYQVKAGDKIRFQAEKINGVIVLTRLQAAP